MTVLDVPLAPRRLAGSIRAVRRVLPMVGCGVPADALDGEGVAEWVRRHGVTVTACGDDELTQVLGRGVRPEQLVLRCGPRADTARRAVRLGVRRYLVSTERHVDVLADCTSEVVHLYLDELGPAVLGERHLDICGMHCDVDDFDDWGRATGRLLDRVALMWACGSRLTRISLAGGSASVWLAGGAELVQIASAVDAALDDGCARWRLPRPAVALAARRA
ncbi:hypothetical protein [Mycolicibacterium sp.]|uniref:hypothetical protein n=1 Tax=Mycolicibacterium sp. TaxID=2320850 RepID=UPI003D0B4565